MVSLPEPVLEFLGRVAYEAHLIRPLLPTYLHILLSAIFPIYVAAHASLSRPKSASPAAKSKEGEEDVEEEAPAKVESLTASDAILFPILAGCTLCGLYFLLKWLEDPAWLNWVLGIYFSQAGVFFLTGFIRDYLSVIRSFVFPSQFSRNGATWKIDFVDGKYCFKFGKSDKTWPSPLPGLLIVLIPASLHQYAWKFRSLLYTRARLHLQIHKFLKLKSSFDSLLPFSFFIAVLITAYQTFVAKPWYLTNLTGFSFGYGAMQLMSPTSGWIGTLILGALFFYDIYFVFLTPIMVTVATKLDVPIKLLFPRPEGMGMLGLGDIVIPGIVIAFALRFDLYLYYLRQQKSEGEKPAYVPATAGWGERFWTSKKLHPKELKAKNFPKVYFYATLSGYLAGMIVTVLVMQVAQHAQPALLYLVPGVLFSMWGTALMKGDLKTLWNYTEEEEEDEKKNETGNANDKEKDEKQGKEIKSLESSEKLDPKTSDTSTLQLISFSITVPAKSSSNTSTASSTATAETTAQSTVSPAAVPDAKIEQSVADIVHKDSEGSTVDADKLPHGISGIIGRNGEPPEKRRRKA